MQVLAERMMTEEEAKAMDAQIVTRSDDWFRTIAPMMMEMRERQGYLALGYKDFSAYCQSVDERLFGHGTQVKRLVDRAEVEAATGEQIPARHAFVLARLPDADAIREVYNEVIEHHDQPAERNFETYVDGWFRKNQPDTSLRIKGKKGKTEDAKGWKKSDLEDDEELALAFDRLEKCWGKRERDHIQSGGLDWPRKDIIALSGFHISKLKEIHYLIMGNHWSLKVALAFVNKKPDAKTTIHELQNHCLATGGFYYTCAVEGFDITIKACKALTSKITA